jgi:hypothetical protein
MSSEAIFKTIADLEAYWYGQNQFFTKDAPVLSSTTGVYNAVYGAMTWAALNQEANAFGMLPKYPWRRSGWRVKTVRPAESGGGVAESGTIPATIKPTYVEVSASPKRMAHAFDNSDIQEYLARESLDDAYGAMEQLRNDLGIHHREMINVSLCRDISAEAAAASGNRDATYDSSHYYEIESLDRVISSDSEEDTFGGTYDNWFDIYGKDRDSSTTGFDAYVNHNSGTDRALTDLLIRTMLQNCKTYGGNTSVILTGLDTYADVQGLYESYGRYNPVSDSKVSFDVNGIQTAEGLAIGIQVPSLYGKPLVTTKNAPQDTKSRMFFLDTSDPEQSGMPRLGIMVMQPTAYYETGMRAGNPFSVDSFTNQGLYTTVAEIVCRQIVGQGKLRDLK